MVFMQLSLGENALIRNMSVYASRQAIARSVSVANAPGHWLVIVMIVGILLGQSRDFFLFDSGRSGGLGTTDDRLAEFVDPDNSRSSGRPTTR
jgi:hypothetical protein